MTRGDLLHFIERHIYHVQMWNAENQEKQAAVMFPAGACVRLTPHLLRELLKNPRHKLVNITCPACGGTGWVEVLIPAEHGRGMQSLGHKRCDTCRGKGFFEDDGDSGPIPD